MGSGTLRVGIVGAGIGGLAAAAALAQAGHEVEMFDRFDSPRPVGSGLVIQPVGLAVLDALGAGAAARAAGARIGRMLGRDAATRRRVLDVRYARRGTDSFGLGIHRAALFAALLAAATEAGARIVPNAEVTAAPLAALRRIETAAGAYGPFDLVIDAAGAGSPLSPLAARPLPYGAVWGTVPWPRQTQLPYTRLTQRYRRASRMAGVLPIGHLGGAPLAAVFWSLPRAAVAAWPDTDFAAWKAEAGGFWPGFTPFLETLAGPADLTPALYAHGTLARPWAERLVHVGDAAHRASPQLGQGANMALLDAWALARALERHPLPEALPAYAAMRRWHVRMYQWFSAAFTPQYQSDSRWLPVLRDRLLFPLSRVPPAPWVLNRLVCGDLMPPLAGQPGV